MSIIKEVWNTLLESAPAACTVALGEVAKAGDLDSIRYAVEAGVASAGDDNAQLKRIRELTDRLFSESADGGSASLNDEAKCNAAFDHYLSHVTSVPALDAALVEMVRQSKQAPAAALVRRGASPYRAVPLDNHVLRPRARLINAAGAYVAMGELSALMLHDGIFGRQPITSPEQLPREIVLTHNGAEFACNLLEASILKKHIGVANRIRAQIVPGSAAEDLYLQMGDQVCHLLGLTVESDAGKDGALPAARLEIHSEAAGFALHLIGNGAKMRSPKQWNEVFCREVGGRASPLFAALQPDPVQSRMHSYDLSRQDMCSIFNACIENGLDVNRVDKGGSSFLIDAVCHENTKLVEVLLLAGADTSLSISSPDGPYTALDFALEKNNETIIQMLRSAQARQAIMSVAEVARKQP